MHGWFSYINAPDKRPKVTWQLIKRVLAYSTPYRWKIAGMLLAILASTGLSLLTPLIMRDLIDKTIPSRNVNRLVILALILLAIPILNGLISVAQRWLNSSVGEGVIYDLRVALYAHLQRMSLRFFTNTKTGELMSRLNNDVIGAQSAISNTTVNMITYLIQGIGIGAVMLTMEWRLTLASILVLPVFWLISRRLGRVLRDITRQQMSANAQMNAMMNETLNIGGSLLVKLFGRQVVEVNRFEDRAQMVRDLGVNRAVTGSSFFVVISMVSAVGMAVVYGLGGYFAIRGAFSIGTIVAFGSYLTQMYGVLQGLANAPVEFAQSVVSFERVFEVVDLPEEIEEKKGALVLQEAAGALEFDNVCFRYEIKKENLLSEPERFGSQVVMAALSGGTNGSRHDGQKSRDKEEGGVDGEELAISQARDTALEEISFLVRPGQLAALVGPSGAGKTTLTYLIPRLYDPTEGCILIDGHDLRDVTLDSLTAQVGMVTQETHLFHDSIRTNLQYAKLDATQAELEAACRAANIHNFIAGLQDGYDTIVGERGYRLSGGEKQRIALARVILKNPRILVLDEATSHLDSESEMLIQDALKRVMAGRTSIVIAHRLSTILAADLILVLDRGRIVERGTHRELLDLGGLYAHLYETQFRRDQLETGGE